MVGDFHSKSAKTLETHLQHAIGVLDVNSCPSAMSVELLLLNNIRAISNLCVKQQSINLNNTDLFFGEGWHMAIFLEKSNGVIVAFVS